MNHVIMSACAFDKGRSGISQYIVENAKEFLRKGELTVILSRNDSQYWSIEHPRLHKFILPAFLDNPALNSLFHLLIFPFIVFFLDIFHHYECCFLPALNRRLFIFYPIKTVGTIHDLSQFTMHNKYSFSRTIYIKFIIPLFIRNKNNLILVSVSEKTRDDLQKFLLIKKDNVHVIYNGYDQLQFNSQVPHNIQTVLEKYKLHEGFIVYVARIEHPGKNHINLVKAYEKLPLELRQKHHLVLVGSAWNGADVVYEYARHSIACQQIVFTGFVPAEELPAFYHAASMLIMPSLYEGFGIPLIEAMACGTVVACADAGAMPEVAGLAAYLFNPLDVEEMRNVMNRIIHNPILKNDLRSKGYQRIRQFDWQFHNIQLMRLVQELCLS